MSEVLRKMRDVPAEYDLVEIWINEIEDLSLDDLVKKSEKPLLIKVTDFSGKSLIEDTMRNNISYIDIDIKAGEKIFDFIIKNKKDTKLIISHHDFEKTPSFEDGVKLIKLMQKTGADIGKIVFKANKIEDNVVPFRLIKSVYGLPLITFCMSDLGRISRICAGSFGSLIDFVPPDTDWQTAEGQIVYDEWKKARKLFARDLARKRENIYIKPL